MMLPRIFIARLHGELGSREVTAEELGRKFDLSPCDIARKTGVTRLFRFGGDETLEIVSVNAARAVLGASSVEQLNLRGVFASCNATGETLMPGYAVHVASALGFTNMLADQVGMACGGGLQALRAAYDRLVVHALREERASYLVVAGDATSHILDPDDLVTGLLFSEGVSVLLVTNDQSIVSGGYEIVRIGTKSLLGYVNALRVGNPYSPMYDGARAFLAMESDRVFRFGAGLLPHLLALVGEQVFQADWMLIPHQANERMLQALARRGRIPESRVYMDGIRRIGNTSPSAVFLGIEDCLRRDLFNVVDTTVLLGAFGAELTVGAALLRPVGDPHQMLR